MEITVLGIGQESPFPRPIPGALSVGILVHEFLTVVIQSPVSAEDVGFVEGVIQGIGWYELNEHALGFLMLILTNTQGEQFPVASFIAPSSKQMLREWGDLNRDDNTCLIVLIDSNSNKIACIRYFGIPKTLLIDMRSLARTLVRTSVDIDCKNEQEFFSSIEADKNALWNAMRQWVYDSEQDMFIENLRR